MVLVGFCGCGFGRGCGCGLWVCLCVCESVLRVCFAGVFCGFGVGLCFIHFLELLPHISETAIERALIPSDSGSTLLSLPWNYLKSSQPYRVYHRNHLKSIFSL